MTMYHMVKCVFLEGGEVLLFLCPVGSPNPNKSLKSGFSFLLPLLGISNPLYVHEGLYNRPHYTNVAETRFIFNSFPSGQFPRIPV